MNAEGSGEQVQEYILNIKSIFERMEIGRAHEEQRQQQE